MATNDQYSRRKFFKTSALASTFLVGGSSLIASSCSNKSDPCDEGSSVFHAAKIFHADGISGLLYSQIGYELDYPVKVILRLPSKEMMHEETVCTLIPTANQKTYQTECIYWGEIWQSHWWMAEFKTIEEAGRWNIEVKSENEVLFFAKDLIVAQNILWERTIEYASVDMLERRANFTGLNAGWQDAGTLWVESPAQSAMVIALTEMLEKANEKFEPAFKERIYKQITVGCDYLLLTQQKATELGFPLGAMSHDVKGHEKDILPHDAMKAAVALAMAVQYLPEQFDQKKKSYTESANLAFNWLLNYAKPMGDYGYVRMQRGLSENAVIPKNEWPTRDLLMMCRASLAMQNLNWPNADQLVVNFARQLMDRQIPKEKMQSGYYGHFYEFTSMNHSEPSWTHGIVPGEEGAEFGTDMGGIFPNYLMPLIEMLKVWPGHHDAERWKKTLHEFAFGFLIPACERNPFLLVPQGIFEGEGPIWFCGTFHGTNAIYGYTAALALELSTLFNEPKLKEIAYANLQWLAGLNAGITKENLKASVVFNTDVPENMALPASMMCGVGNRWAGTWFQTRGVICNGFSTGKQFQYDVEPKEANDGPFSFTDEDWIPHSAAWLSGLIRL